MEKEYFIIWDGEKREVRSEGEVFFMKNYINKLLRLLIFVSVIIFSALSQSSGESSVPGSLLDLEEAFQKVAENVSPSVVNISTRSSMNADIEILPFDKDLKDKFPWFEDFFSNLPEENILCAASGVIISEDGFVITNAHVVKDTSKLSITTHNGKKYEDLQIVGIDSETDLAVIKIKSPHKFSVAPLGNSDNVKVGSWAIAIGNPFGYSSTLTVGIISATGRDFYEGGYGDMSNLIQTDASINPGNSGGALVNIRGEVIGINTAIISAGGRSSGIGFAIPVNIVKKVSKQLIEKGKVLRGWLGVVIKDLSSELSSYFGADNGVLIEDIIPGGPADNGGIKSGDIVLSIDDAEMDSVRKLQNTISGKSPGEKITLSVLRNKKKETVTLIVGQRPEERKKDISHSTVPHSEEWRGLSVEDLTDDLSSRLKQNKGVIVRGVKTGSLAEESGIKPGNIIIKINDRELNNIKDYKDFIKSIKNKEDVVCLVYDGKYMTFLVIKGE